MVPRWVVWLFVHLTFLNGFGNRGAALFRWAKAMVGRSRPERVFSVGHTGGDLSLPEKIRAQVMPSPFPVMEVRAERRRTCTCANRGLQITSTRVKTHLVPNARENGAKRSGVVGERVGPKVNQWVPTWSVG